MLISWSSHLKLLFVALPLMEDSQVTSVNYKAQAILIKTFLETAATPKFRHSLLKHFVKNVDLRIYI